MCMFTWGQAAAEAHPATVRAHSLKCSCIVTDSGDIKKSKLLPKSTSRIVTIIPLKPDRTADKLEPAETHVLRPLGMHWLFRS